MDDGTDDRTDGWKGRRPPDRLRILYIKIGIHPHMNAESLPKGTARQIVSE